MANIMRKQFSLIFFIIIINNCIASGIEYSELTNKPIINDQNSKTYWFELGLGSSYFGPLLSRKLNFGVNNNLFSIRYLSAKEFQFDPAGNDYDEPQLKLNELSILYGRQIKSDIFVLSISGGIGYLDGILRGDHIAYNNYKKIVMPRFSIPLEASTRVNITDFFGFGASFVSNLNNKKNLLCVTLNLYLGKI